MRKKDDGIMKINALLRNWQSCTPSPACTLAPWQFGGGNLQKKRCKENVEENVERFDDQTSRKRQLADFDRGARVAHPTPQKNEGLAV